MIYLSGKITGLDREDYLDIFDYHEKQAQRTVFKKFADSLELDGMVINPAKTMDTLPNLLHAQYMELSMQLLKMCDTIYMIPNWEKSEGSKRELNYAIEHNYTIIIGDNA
jgi:hypothetical protein